MNCDQIQTLLIDYDEGRLGPAETAEVRLHLETCAACSRELAAVRELNLALRNIPAPVPSPRVRAAFYAWLESEKESLAKSRAEAASVRLSWARRAFSPMVTIAAACTIFGVGLWIGNGNRERAAREQAIDRDAIARELANLRSQVQSTQDVVAWSMVQQGSPTERLKTVLSLNSPTASTRPGTIDELLGILAYDGSVSVRLNAVEALLPHADAAMVRFAVASALPRETSPLVQLAMIDFLAATRDPSAASTLENFAQSDTQSDEVRDAARHALAQM